MKDVEKQSLLGICLAAAYADGDRSSTEHERIQRAETALNLGPLDLPDFYEHAPSGMLSVHALAQAIETPETKRLAYEMALGVCEADNHLNPAEQVFLNDLQKTLALDDATVEAARQTTRQLQAQVLPAAPQAATPPLLQSVPPAGLDRLILEHAILCGALELLPETLATMAILPTQMRMVYEIGRAHGFTLDRGHIREFLMTAGVGMTSQVVEAYATKLAKGLLGKFLGGVGRAAAAPITGAALSFSTTYALGHVARQYYAGGRSLTAIQLRSAFDTLKSQADTLQAKYLPEMESCSRNLRLQNLLPIRTS